MADHSGFCEPLGCVCKHLQPVKLELGARGSVLKEHGESSNVVSLCFVFMALYLFINLLLLFFCLLLFFDLDLLVQCCFASFVGSWCHFLSRFCMDHFWLFHPRCTHWRLRRASCPLRMIRTKMEAGRGKMESSKREIPFGN